MQERDRHAAELLPGLCLERWTVAAPVRQPRLARRLREGRPRGGDGPEPHPQKRVVDPIQAPLAGAGIAPERRLPADQSHLGERRQRPRQTGGRTAETTCYLADPMRAGADHVQQRAECRGRRHLLQEQPVRLRVQRAGRVEHQRVDGALEVESERLGELPVARHPAPRGVECQQVAPSGAREQVGEVSRSQRAHGEGLARAAVERRPGGENRAVHHALARTAHHQGRAFRRRVDPSLQDAGQGRIRREQVGQLVQHERSGPTGGLRIGDEPRQEGAPVRILHVGESRKPVLDRGSQVAPLHRRSGRIGRRVQAAMTPRPLDEQARLAHPATPPDDGEGARLDQRGVEPAHLVGAVDEAHDIIM